MTIEHGKIEGDFTVHGEFMLHGMITGSATVETGAKLALHGMVCGDLIIENGAQVDLHGMVCRDVWNNGGTLEVRGMIIGTLHEHAGQTTVADNASIGQRQ